MMYDCFGEPKIAVMDSNYREIYSCREIEWKYMEKEKAWQVFPFLQHQNKFQDIMGSVEYARLHHFGEIIIMHRNKPLYRDWNMIGSPCPWGSWNDHYGELQEDGREHLYSEHLIYVDGWMRYKTETYYHLEKYIFNLIFGSIKKNPLKFRCLELINRDRKMRLKEENNV